MKKTTENCGLYIHIPFCRRRCDYCNFFFILNTGLKGEFISSLLKEIELYSRLYPEKIFDSIYFGGGTPSILNPSEIEMLLSVLHSNFRIDNLKEVTLECNPEDLNEEKIYGYKNAGVNRISLGTQSFIDEELKFLSREHSAKQELKILELTKKFFSNYTIDLIYSLPGQTEESLKTNLEIVTEISPPHISAYTLTFEKKTPLYKRLEANEVVKNSEETESEFYLLLSDKLRNSGYEHYEVSSFAKENFKAYHNSKYWTGAEYLGLGPSAHTYMNGERWNNVLSVKKYSDKIVENILPFENRKKLSRQELREEKILLSLRSTGINFDELSGLLDSNGVKIIAQLIEDGNAFTEKGKFKLTTKGFAIADEITSRLIGLSIGE